ncbi:acetyltransferase [Ochromonadaceae sp. CCMP2298]|nr:acetyltransferase [Ochromonadaceae sp. CCMP2298]
MATRHENEYGQEVGFPIPGWTVPDAPASVEMRGRTCIVEPLDDARHAGDLHAAFGQLGASGDDWAYLPYGPFDTREDLEAWMVASCFGADSMFFAIVDLQGRAVGMASYLIKPCATIEVGNVCFSQTLQRSRTATEAMYLLMGHAFASGCRRCEWKCNALNLRSRRAAQRFGFSYEGTSRQHMVVKSQNRDTAWFACMDGEWGALKGAFEVWLDDANFDTEGCQLQSLADLTRRVTDPLARS